MKQCHTGAPRGKRVLVILRDGTRLRDHFVERRADEIVPRSSGRISKKRIRAFAIIR